MTKSTPPDNDGDDESSSSRQRLPLLMLAPEPDRTGLLRFFNLETRETMWVTDETYCFSSNGWLHVWSITLSMSLVNPFTGVSVPLPHGLHDGSNIDDFEDFFDDSMCFIQKFAMSSGAEKDDDFFAFVVIHRGRGNLWLTHRLQYHPLGSIFLLHEVGNDQLSRQSHGEVCILMQLEWHLSPQFG